MSRPKPALGYRSRTEAVLALREAGRSRAEIAAMLGIEVKNVTSLEESGRRSARRRGELIAFKLSASLARCMIAPAVRRGITPSELARRIVETVVDGDLIDAVLDDRDG